MTAVGPGRQGYNGSMKRASITEAKNNFSALVDSVKSGASVLIVDRGRPVARLEPVAGPGHGSDGRLAELTRAGIVRPAREPMSKSVLEGPLPRAKRGGSVLQALLDERREGR